MVQNLSAMNYIRNNKRRVSVLIVSLALYLVAVYVTQFILSATTESFRLILTEDTKKMQLIDVGYSVYGIDTEGLGEEEIRGIYQAEQEALMEKLRKQDGVVRVYETQRMGSMLHGLIGQYSFEFPIKDAEMLAFQMEHMGAVLKEGRLPEAPGELILDESLLKNTGLKLGDRLSDEAFQIVGVAESGSYFGGGIEVADRDYSRRICIFSDGRMEDVKALLRELGYEFGASEVWVSDSVTGEADYEDVKGEVNTSAELVFTALVIVMAIMLFFVYTTALRDRHSEWCLYCSIGFGRKAIYLSILREMLFCFVVAVAAGSVVSGIGMVAVDKLLIEPMGLACRYIDFHVMATIVCGYAAVFVLLQFPIRYALHRIRTVDAMEDDLY